jgi:hypothetical protein
VAARISSDSHLPNILRRSVRVQVRHHSRRACCQRQISAAAKQFTPALPRRQNFVCHCVRIPPRRNCDAAGRNATGESNQECSKTRSRCVAVPLGGQRTVRETHLPQKGIGTACQYPDADSARKAVTGLVREINADILQRCRLLMTMSEACDHFVQRELTKDNSWRSYSTKKAYKAYLNRWIIPHWGSMRLSEVRTTECGGKAGPIFRLQQLQSLTCSICRPNFTPSTRRARMRLNIG